MTERARACPCAPVTQNSEPPNQKKRHKKAKEQASLKEAFFGAALDDPLSPGGAVPDGMDEEQFLNSLTLTEILEWLNN